MAGIRLFVDPRTNSADPDKRMAYGLSVAPPWAGGGALFINFPEHLEYMPGTKGLARHHDERDNVWQVDGDGQGASYEAESLTEEGVVVRAQARVEGDTVHCGLEVENNGDRDLKSLRPMLCHEYHGLTGFAPAHSDNFARTFVVVGGQVRALDDFAVERPEARARMAQVKGCPDRHNWWAAEMGGLIKEELDMAFTAIEAADGRKVVVFWNPGKCLLANRAIPCLHADPYLGDLAPGERVRARGQVLFTRASLAEVAARLAASAERPWERG